MLRPDTYESYSYEKGFAFGLVNKNIIDRPNKRESCQLFILGYQNAKGI